MSLDELIRSETARPLPQMVTSFACKLAASHPSTAAVLFHGSCLRDGTLSGIADFYVLSEGRLGLTERLLAPTVRYVDEGGVRAKVSSLPLSTFTRSMRPGAFSPHLWARFCQPVALAWVRDAEAAKKVRAALAEAIHAASWWAERLAPAGASAEEAWRNLFHHTYGAELRAEGQDRPRALVAADPEHWRRVAALCFTDIPPAERKRAARAWVWRRRLGRVLTAARLAKGAFTFTGGVDYLAWKIERHSGQRVDVTPWQRRHPILAGVPLLIRLKKQGIIR